MAISRPSNHVTKDLAKRFRETGAPCPDLTEAQLVWLEAHYPPKCFNPNEGSESNHHAYRGKVELIAMLRVQLTERQDTDEHMNPLDMPADLASA